EKPQIVFVDLRMPGINGLEVLKLSNEFAPEIPKIVISGANQISDVVRALRYGAWDYLEKPVKDLSILKHAVTKALEKAQLLSENREYQEHLEAMVQERTQELEQANIHLSNINTRLKRIVETTHGLSAIVETDHFGVKILDEFAHHMLATGGSLYFVENDGLRRMHSLDPGHAPDFLPFPLSKHSVLSKVLESGKPILVQDVINDEAYKSSGWNGYKDGSLLSFPIPDNLGNTIGVLTLHSKIEPPFIEQDKEIGAILASYSCETLRAVQAFEALQKSEKQYRSLFEKSNDAIFVVEKGTGKYLDANQAAAELTGRSQEELTRLTTREVTPEGAAKRILAITDSNSPADLGNVTYCRPDNTLRIAKLSAVALGDNAVIGIARDITQ
ncbi:MAG: response regulator, partial [Desulfobacteraceae bacterium]|nr:response regulator [Desulfobacteraceae bacterium]